ncbi:unnamed protein product [Owenia fusiformis]|nr:unnamed protein product [Owenia fusiformis]
MGMASQIPNRLRNIGFGFRALKKNYALVPLVTIISFACLMGTSMIVYSLATKPDVRFDRKRKHIPYNQEIQVEESRKLREVNPEKYTYDPEIVKLREELGKYQANVHTNEL